MRPKGFDVDRQLGRVREGITFQERIDAFNAETSEEVRLMAGQRSRNESVVFQDGEVSFVVFVQQDPGLDGEATLRFVKHAVQGSTSLPLAVGIGNISARCKESPHYFVESGKGRMKQQHFDASKFAPELVDGELAFSDDLTEDEKLLLALYYKLLEDIQTELAQVDAYVTAFDERPLFK